MAKRFWCYLIIFILLSISLVFLTIKMKEKYIILQDIESDSVSVFKDSLPKSLKYRGHRYNRHRLRSNPHTRTYYHS